MLCVLEFLLVLSLPLAAKCVQDGAQVSEKKPVLYLLTLLPYYNPEPTLNPSWNDGDNIRPALELAKDQINNSSTLLQNHTLELIHTRSGCDRPALTATGFVTGAYNSSRGMLAGIIGPGCSTSTLELVPLTNRDQLALVMLHGSGSPVLADRQLYPYSLGTLGPTDNFAREYLYLLERANWNRVAILYDISNLYYEGTKRFLVSEIPKNITEFLSPVTTFFMPLQAIKDERLRVIFVLCPLELSRRILCLSSSNDMVYGGFQWVYMDQTYDELAWEDISFVYEGQRYNCSKEELADALEMTFLLTFNLKPADEKTPVVSNITYEEYLEYYKMYREQYNSEEKPIRNSIFTVWATYLYDAVWAWAFALDTITRQGHFEASYGNINQSEKIVELLYRTKFSGMSGEIDFQRESGYSNRKVNIQQVINGIPVKIAPINSDTVENRSEPVFVQDSFPNNTRESVIVGAIFVIILMLQLISAVVLQILTAAYHKKPSIKASSPKLLHLSYIGFYIICIGMLIWNFKSAASAFIADSLRHYFCQLLWCWCFPLGLVLAVGPVGMRTWRVYRIFKHYLDPGPLISDPILLTGVVLLLLPLVTVAVVWTALDPMVSVQQFDFERGQRGMPLVKTVCNCDYYFVWLGLILSYIACISLLVTLLGFMTRNISNPSFATTALRVLMYVESILMLLGFPMFYLLVFTQFNPLYSSLVLGVNLILMLEVFVVCIFLPPLLPIIRLRWKSLKVKTRKISIISASSTSSAPSSPITLYF